MRLRVVLLTLSVVALALPATASADFVHTVMPGESLSSIAATDGLSVAQLAAANGLSLDAQLITGTNIQIPPQGVAATASAASAPATVGGGGDGDSDDVGAAPAAATSSTATAPAAGSGSYVVQAGDTLSGIAARAGTTVAALAAANGLDPNALLPAGVALRLSGAAGTAVPVSQTISLPQSGQPVGAAAQGSPSDPPYPTPERLTASQIGQIGASNGATWALTDAIAWQESGFNNDLVSSADARGIMQITPGTWAWIQQSLDSGAPLGPASATDNVRGGSIMLNWLLRQTGGDPAMAAAGYYQGISSVRQNGMFPDTQQYVNDVMALRQHFGGG